MKKEYSPSFVSDVIAIAWADDISFDKIKNENGVSESEVIKMMRSHLKPGSFKVWRIRVSGRKSNNIGLFATRYDKTAQNFLGSIYMASIVILLN